ncbi:MAG: 30S ribosomal protein S20 [Patescibacteria group bacterium]
MPNKPSAMKELRKTKKRTVHNVRIKTNVRALLSKCKELVAKGDFEEAKKTAILLQRAADKAAKVNVLSDNSANRKKARIMKLIAKSTKK